MQPGPGPEPNTRAGSGAGLGWAAAAHGCVLLRLKAVAGGVWCQATGLGDPAPHTALRKHAPIRYASVRVRQTRRQTPRPAAVRRRAGVL